MTTLSQPDLVKVFDDVKGVVGPENVIQDATEREYFSQDYYKKADPVAAIIKAWWGQLLFEGKVVDVERKATEGFLRGKALIQGLSNYADQEFLVHFQNEFSVGYLNGDAIVMTPDLICVLDTVSGDGIGTDVLRYGQRVSVLALPGPEIFRTQAGLDAVGPRAFGFDLDYECIFDKV